MDILIWIYSNCYQLVVASAVSWIATCYPASQTASQAILFAVSVRYIHKLDFMSFLQKLYDH